MCENKIYRVILLYSIIFTQTVKLDDENKLQINTTNKDETKNLTQKAEKNLIESTVKLSDLNETHKKPITTDVDYHANVNLSLTPDAFIRGFYVFVGLGVIVLIYLGIKTIRVNKPPTSDSTVRKYGVKARRGDLEMLPLPLIEEDDDDTLFDVENHIRTES